MKFQLLYFAIINRTVRLIILLKLIKKTKFGLFLQLKLFVVHQLLQKQ